MKRFLRCILVLTLLLATVASPVMAEVEADAQLERFFEALVVGNIPVEVATLTQDVNTQTFEGETTTSYRIADYLYVDTVTDSEYTFVFRLYTMPSETYAYDADHLYALFINACTGGAVSGEDAAALVAWLREYGAQTSVYGMDAYRAIPGFTLNLSTSFTQAEECLSLTQYSCLR